MLQMTKNATLDPYSLSVYERLRKIMHSDEWFQRYNHNIILQGMITVGFFFVGGDVVFILLCPQAHAYIE